MAASSSPPPASPRAAAAGDRNSTSSLPPANLERMDPDSILAEDTLFNADSESEYGSSRRSSFANNSDVGDGGGGGSKSNSDAATAAAPTTPSSGDTTPSASVFLENHSGDAGIAAATMTPTQSTHNIAALADDGGATPSSSSPEAELRALRSQVEDLTNQVTGLNGKLVNSFMRISDLEDDLSDAKERVMGGSTRVAELEKERQEHLAALNTGLLVEKAHVSTEMQRMMDRVIEETKQRGQAESDKAKIESELDELSASLFNEANRMVAVEKLARARAEEKSRQMEERLQDTEGIMLEQQKVLADLQKQLDAYKDATPDTTTDQDPSQSSLSLNGAHTTTSDSMLSSTSLARPIATRQPSMSLQSAAQLATDHRLLMLDIVPYQELRAFLNHLRKLRKQLSPFYNYPYEPKHGGLAHKHSASVESNPTPQRPASPAVTQTLQSAASVSSYGMTTDYNGHVQSNPFIMAGIGRHKDYPTLPSNCEQLVHLPSQLSVPFIKRAQEEDSEPCLRLDFAPGFNWLTRRTANSAILEGNLVIEPVFAGGVVENEDAVRAEHAHLPPAACAMCGMLVVNVPLPGGEEAGKSSGGSGVTSWASSITAVTGSAASSLREAAGSSPGLLGASTDSSSTTSDGKPPPLKSNRSGLFSSFASLRGMTGSPKPARDSTPPTPVAEAPPSAAAEEPAQTANASASASASPNFAQPPTPTTPASSKTSFPTPNGPLPVPTHIFRLSDTATTRYLLCPHHCLSRLRAACAFWTYLRNIERAVVLEGKLAWDDEQARATAAAAQSAAGRTKPLPKINTGGDVSEDAAKSNVAEASQALKSVVEAGDSDEATDAKSPSTAEGGDAAVEETPTTSTEAEAPSGDGDETVIVSQASESEGARDGETSPKTSGIETRSSSSGEEGFEDAQNGGSSNVTDDEQDSTGEGKQAKSASEDVAGEVKEETSSEVKVDDSPAHVEEAAPTKTEEYSSSPPAETTTSSTATTTTEATTPASPSVSSPPAVPPRRQHRPVPAVPSTTTPTSATPPSLPARSSASAAPTTPLPESKKRLPLDADTTSGGVSWEEKVFIEITKLKRDMWEARAGIVSGSGQD